MRDGDETINHKISECSRLAQKEYKARHAWVGKVIPGKCAKKLNLTMPTNVICTTQHIISASRPDLIINKKEKSAKLSTLLSRLATE